MDPVGPWSAYASYNRLAQAGSSGELHHHHLSAAGSTSTTPTTTAQLLPGGFLPPTPVGYEAVFTPLFHHAGTKPPAHYVTQHRALAQAASKQSTDGEYHQPFFEQGNPAWQQNSPFGILPHESVVPTTKAANYESFNAHFAAAQSLNHLNSQLAAKNATRAQSPQVTTAITKTSNSFFQAPVTFRPETSTTKAFTPNSSNIQPTCIVTSPSHRVPQAPARAYISSPNPQRNVKPTPQIQTKAQTKIYSEVNNQQERRNEEPQSQSSPISFSMEVPGRINYAGSNSSAKFPNYRHYPQNSNSEDFQRANGSNGPDCNVVVPRRPSPLQAHSQASPLGHAPSPAYPMYNSPMNSISSPQQSSQVTPPSPLDVSVPRPTSQPNNIVYPSVITRTLNTEKPFPQNSQCWDERQRKFPNIYSGNNNIVDQRQQTYFDNQQQVNLQDLSSCRGDPMSLVKNLQSCQVPEVKPPVKRRKSGESKERVPPPAHSSVPNQQQQNGGFGDFDRWNLPPPASKIFPHQQQLMVPHPAPPLPYFPPFHLPPHPHEFEMPPNYDNTQPHYPPQQPQEEQPKVVVPNIEEELNFLSQVPANQNSQKPLSKSPDKPNGSGFMGSYLKFLQGDRDGTPPPANRTTRKQTWSRPKPVVQEPENNGVPPPPPRPQPVKRLSQGDPQDDPRYFPLPKERKRNSFDSDSDGIISDDDFFVTNNKKVNNSSKAKKRKSAPTEKKKKKPATSKERKEREVEVIPRRESSKRAAKEKSSYQHLVKNDDDIEEPPEFQDSDSDPAWTPKANDDEEEILPITSKKIRKSSGRKRRNLIATAAHGAGIQEVDGYSSEKKSKAQKNKQSAPPTLEDNIAASLPNNSLVLNDDNPYKPGEFVVIKSELCQEPWPSIWRVDGKTLLQKYEPFEQNGLTFYKNISTYTSWTPDSKKQYISIPVRYRTESQHETIVEFLRHEMNVIDPDFHEKCMKDMEGFQDNFEVYIQTLISQALDSNFLTEIFQEKDEYFLSNVKTIDDITDTKKKKLLVALRWPPAVQAAVCTWPCFNVIREVNPSEAHSKSCAACGQYEVSVRVLMYGQPYNSTTLEGCQPDPKAMNEKNFLMCRLCATRIELSNKVTHQKYLMYIECAKRVGEKRTSNPSKDTTCILNELLADENWLNQLFYQVRTNWADIDCIEQSFRVRNVYAQ